MDFHITVQVSTCPCDILSERAGLTCVHFTSTLLQSALRKASSTTARHWYWLNMVLPVTKGVGHSRSQKDSDLQHATFLLVKTRDCIQVVLWWQKYVLKKEGGPLCIDKAGGHPTSATSHCAARQQTVLAGVSRHHCLRHLRHHTHPCSTTQITTGTPPASGRTCTCNHSCSLSIDQSSMTTTSCP
jgi:hypothetical protein